MNKISRSGLLLAIFFCLFIQTDLRASNNFLIKPGEWRGVLLLHDSIECPFTFTVGVAKVQRSEFLTLTIHNADEHIVVENLTVTNDSVSWRMPVFDSWFSCKRESDSTFSGTWFNNSASKPYQLKFKAARKDYRFFDKQYFFTYALNGNYETTFNPQTPDEYKAIGIFETRTEKGKRSVAATFQTETGDYRYLAGVTRDFTTHLSTFDGAHAYVFRIVRPRRQTDTLYGEFFSGIRGYEKFTIVKNENFQLRDPEKLTWVTDSNNVNFTFNDLNGKPVSLNDPGFKGKVVIVQIMGSWCPNCMDETKWLADIYKKYQPKGLEIIALAYERSSDTSKANSNIRRIKNRYQADYTFLNTGKSGRDSASASLPFLNGIMSFPTTIYIDRSGKVRKVFTGFNGPATGGQYDKDTAEALRFIEKLLGEEVRR